MRARITVIVVVVAVLAAGFYLGRPFLQGYLAARGQVVPMAPPNVVNQPPVTAPPAKGQSGIAQMEKQYPALTTSQGNTQDNSQSDSQSNNSSVPDKASVSTNTASGESQIDEHYLAQLNGIGQYYQGRLNALVGQAYASYLAVKEGKSKTPLLSLMGRYVGEGETLQRDSDTQFYGVWNQYVAALTAAGLPTTYADRAKADYVTAEAAEKNRILSAAEQYLK